MELAAQVAMAGLAALLLLVAQEHMAGTVWVWLGTSQSPITARLLEEVEVVAAAAAQTMETGTAVAAVEAEPLTALAAPTVHGLVLALAEPLMVLLPRSLLAATEAKL